MKNIIRELEKIKITEILSVLVEQFRKNKTFRIMAILISGLFIYLAGRSFGEFLYYLKN